MADRLRHGTGSGPCQAAQSANRDASER